MKEQKSKISIKNKLREKAFQIWYWYVNKVDKNSDILLMNYGYHDMKMCIRDSKYAIQITVADERDGALSGSTLKEASSWGKVETTYEQMVFAEATMAMPLIVGYGFHKNNWKNRKPRRLNDYLTGF